MSLTTSSELGIRLTNFCDSMEKELVSRCIKVFRFEPHARRKILFILGEVTVSVMIPVCGKIESQCTEDFKKPIHLIGLKKSSNSEKLAREILTNCLFIDDSMMCALVETIEEMKSKDYDINGVVIQKQTAADGSFLPRFPEIFDEFDMVADGMSGFDLNSDEPDFGQLSHYVDLLYEDIPQKIEASMCLAKLSKCSSYLKDISIHDSAINALFRTLREDSKKSSQLSKNILTICLAFAKFRDFQGILIKNKIEVLALDIIDFEMERCEKWKSQLIEIEAAASKNRSTVSARSLNECHLMWVKLNELMSFQNTLLKVAFQVLNCLSENKDVRENLVQHNVISSLSDALERRDNELLEVVILYLKNMSCYQRCIEQMIASELVDKLTSLLKEGTPIPKKVVKAALHLLYNLSFNSAIRQKIVDCDLVPIILNCFDKPILREITVKILYVLSMEPCHRKKLAKSSLVGPLMNYLSVGIENENSTTTVLASLAVNISRTKRGAKLMWETNNLGELLKRSLAQQDYLGMKIIRNISEHGIAFILCESVKDIASAMVGSSNPEFVSECIGTLAKFDMSRVDVEGITQKGRIFPWLKQTLVHYIERITKNSVDVAFDLNRTTIEVLQLLANICSAEEGARMVVGEGFMEILLKILHAELRNESDIVDHIFYLLKKCAEHKSISSYLALRTRVPSGLLEFAESSSEKWKTKCVMILEQIGKFDETWKENIQQFHFISWNREWTDAVTLEEAEAAEENIQGEEELGEIHRFGCQDTAYSRPREALSSTGSEEDDRWSSDNGSEFRDSTSNIFGMFRHQFEEEMGFHQGQEISECNSELEC